MGPHVSHRNAGPSHLSTQDESLSTIKNLLPLGSKEPADGMKDACSKMI